MKVMTRQEIQNNECDGRCNVKKLENADDVRRQHRNNTKR
jgi:hypothetical protein